MSMNLILTAKNVKELYLSQIYENCEEIVLLFTLLPNLIKLTINDMSSCNLKYFAYLTSNRTIVDLTLSLLNINKFTSHINNITHTGLTKWDQNINTTLK